MNKEFIEKLKKKLQDPLPGEAAQIKMRPSRLGEVSSDRMPNSLTKKAGVLILLYPRENKIYFPLMLRPNYDGVHGGQISLPGGKKEQGDKSLIDTALREAEEEIGAKINEISVLGTLSELFVFASNIMVLPVVGCLQSPPLFIPNAYEVEEIIETSLQELQEHTSVKMRNLKVRGYNIDAPYFNVEKKEVWGATAMILSEFIAVLKGM